MAIVVQPMAAEIPYRALSSIGRKNTTSGLTAIRTRPTTGNTRGSRPGSGRGRGTIASSGVTLVARQAGRIEAASEPPRAQTPESTTHHRPSAAPSATDSGRTCAISFRSPQPASKPPPQPIRPSRRPSRPTIAPTCPLVNATARSMANWRIRSSTPMLSVVKMMKRAARSEIPIAE